MSSTPRENSAGNGRLEAALRYAAVGWPVFPQAPNAKVPALPSAHPKGDPARGICQGECGKEGHGLWDATTDPERITRWFAGHPDRNVAIRTGAPGPDVVDVDVHEGGSGFAAFNKARRAGLLGGYMAIVRTPSTGMHMYYRGTGQRTAKIAGQHIEFKSQGGCVTVPPSRADGADYVLVKHEPFAAEVDWSKVTDLLEPQRNRPAGRQVYRVGGSDDVERLTEWVAQQEHGNRQDGLYYAANRIIDAGLLDDAAIDRLVSASVRSGIRGGEREARRTIESAQRRAMREARPKAPRRDREAAS